MDLDGFENYGIDNRLSRLLTNDQKMVFELIAKAIETDDTSIGLSAVRVREDIPAGTIMAAIVMVGRGGPEAGNLPFFVPLAMIPAEAASLGSLLIPINESGEEAGFTYAYGAIDSETLEPKVLTDINPTQVQELLNAALEQILEEGEGKDGD